MTKRESALAAGIIGGKKLHKQRLKRIAEYEKNPTLCKQCQKSLSYDAKIEGCKFCNKSCSAKYNNLGVRHNPKIRIEKECLICHKPTFFKFCSSECSARQQRLNVYKLIEGGKYTIGNKRTIKIYLLEKRGAKCEVCGLTEWQGVPIPLESHHSDGNFHNNIPTNLKLICLNCHGITPNYRGKNKGNGRFSRMKR